MGAGIPEQTCFLGPRADVQDASTLPSAKDRVGPVLCCPLAQWPYLADEETEAQKVNTGLRPHS